MIQHGVERSLDLVLKRKAVPPCFAVRVFEDTSVQTAEDIGRVVLGIGAANGGLEIGGEMVAVEVDGGLGESRARNDQHEKSDLGSAQNSRHSFH